MKKPTLILLPNLLDKEADHKQFLPPSVDEAVLSIDGIIAESEKEARAYLKRFSFPAPKRFSDIPIQLLNEHTLEKEISDLLKPVLKGETWGLISDCGLPCLADPGAKLVLCARDKEVEVIAMMGPSSIVLALMLSGLPAQRFSFHGYLAKEEKQLLSQIRQLEKQSLQEKMTHLFIEAPYRSQKMLQQLIQTLSDDTLLCVASNLTMHDQQVICQSVKTWKKKTPPDLTKRPAVFLFVRLA